MGDKEAEDLVYDLHLKGFLVLYGLLTFFLKNHNVSNALQKSLLFYTNLQASIFLAFFPKLFFLPLLQFSCRCIRSQLQSPSG